MAKPKSLTYIQHLNKKYIEKCDYWNWDANNIISKTLLDKGEKDKTISDYITKRSLI